MYIPLQVRLTLFYVLLLGLALWFFGQIVYTQAEQRAYSNLDDVLSSRAASVRLGKLLASGNAPELPAILSSVDSAGTNGVAIEVLDSKLNLLATTSDTTGDFLQTHVEQAGSSPVPWDVQAARKILQHPFLNGSPNYPLSTTPNSMYSTITYQGQQVRVYTLANDDFGQLHIIQTARSEQDIQQSLNNLRQLLIEGGGLVLLFAALGGWLITRGVLARVRHITKTAHSISASQDFSQRVPDKTWVGRDELATLARTFNEMLATLQRLYEQQQRFVADASHELRAPITSIRCNLDLLAKAPDLPEEEARAALADARTEADRMGRLVNDLLTLARADSIQYTGLTVSDGYRKSERQRVDLDSLLLEVFRQYRPGREDKGEDVKQPGPRLLLQHITPATVYGEADQLKQVLVALVDNALKYTPQAGNVSLSLTTEGQFAILQVSDTGPGISPDDLPHIFERFYRADRTRSRDRDRGGTGLGLAIVQSIVQEHQGTIEVESTPGKGTTFTVRLPLAET